MELGFFNLLMHRDNPRGITGVVDDACQLVESAEELGFGTAWFAEHHFTNYSLSVSPLMMAAHMAGRTKRIKLGPCVVVLPLHHPLRAAQEIALLDQQSGGRAVLGLGSGYQPYEFERFGVDVANKTQVFLEYWDVMRAALVEGRVHYDGKHIQLPNTTVAMRPQRAGLPPLFVTSTHPDVLAKFGPDGAVPFISGGKSGRTTERMSARDNALRNWALAGLDPATMPVAMMQFIAVIDTKAEALVAAERGRYYARMVNALRASVLKFEDGMLVPGPAQDEPSLEQFCENYCIGDPHQVAARVVDDIRALDPVHYNCVFQFGDMPIALARRSMERFVAEVLPIVERELGPLDRIGMRPSLRALTEHAA